MQISRIAIYDTPVNVRTDMRELSSVVCGARYRLEILCAIADKPTFTATELLRDLWQGEDPPSQSTISVELRRLREFGLIQQRAGEASDRAVRLEAVDSPVWKAAKTLRGGEQ